MCTAGNYAMGAISAAQDTVNTLSEIKIARQNRDMIDRASVDRQNEIRENGSLQLNETMMAARAARAHSIAAASGSGVNLGSKSFLASLQTTAMATANKSQVELENESNAQQDNYLKTQSELNQKASEPTFLGWDIQNHMAFLQGFMGNIQGYNSGSSNLGGVVDSTGGPGATGTGGADAAVKDTSDDGVFEGAGSATNDQSGAATVGTEESDSGLMIDSFM